MTSLGPWQPLTLEATHELMHGVSIPWWFAGGYAVDAFLGYPSRDHGDIDVAFFRRDQIEMQAWLQEWDLHAADPPGTLRPWLPGEWLAPHIHDIWCRASPYAPWCLQLMLDESENGDWLFRRQPAIRRPAESLVDLYGGRPFLAIEVQLLYKAGPEVPKNEADFVACLPRLSLAQRSWLHEALAATQPDHPWLARLHV